jgi:hypothetical protein
MSDLPECTTIFCATIFDVGPSDLTEAAQCACN